MSWMTMTFTSIPKGAHHDRASTHSQGYATAAVSVTVNSGGFVRVTCPLPSSSCRPILQRLQNRSWTKGPSKMHD